MSKSLSILQKMYPHINVFAHNTIDKYKNQSGNLHSMSIADVVSS